MVPPEMCEGRRGPWPIARRSWRGVPRGGWVQPAGPSTAGLVSVAAERHLILFSLPLGPDVICRWWTSAVTMAISWLQGDDAAVRAHFTEVERVPKALEVTEYVSLLGHFLVSLRGSPRCWARRARLSGIREGAGLGCRRGEGSGGLGGPHKRRRESEEKPSLAGTSVVWPAPQPSALLPGPPPTASVRSQTCDRPGEQAGSWHLQQPAVEPGSGAMARSQRQAYEGPRTLHACPLSHRHPHQSVTQRPLAQA